MTTHYSAATLLATLLFTSLPGTMPAQDSKVLTLPRGGASIRIDPGAASIIWGNAANRAVLGVTLGATSRRDTAGVVIEDVNANGPAAKAGLKAGDVITEVNHVSLRVKEADVDDVALEGLGQRRLQRTMAKAKPGDEVTLRVTSTGASRTVTVKTVSAADLDGSRVRTITGRDDRLDDERSAIGLAITASGNARDTLGLFVSSVVAGGPAERAGIVEGERVAEVNGVDVRVPREDVDDASVNSARVNRLLREVQKVAPGGTVNVKVFANGRYRDVVLKTVKSSELPSSGWQVLTDEGGVRVIRPGAPGTEMLRGFREGMLRDMLAPSRVRTQRIQTEKR